MKILAVVENENRRSLHRATDKNRRFTRAGLPGAASPQISYRLATGPVTHQPEGPLLIVLGHQDDSAAKIRVSQARLRDQELSLAQIAFLIATVNKNSSITCHATL